MGKSVSRYHRLLLYPDDKTHVQALEMIKTGIFSRRCKYAYILHDKDQEVDEETGELVQKKPHWHVVLKLDTKRAMKTVADALGIAENYMKFTLELDSALAYLTHMEEKDCDKHQYSDSEVISNYDYIRDRDEMSTPMDADELMDIVLDILSEWKCEITFTELYNEVRHRNGGTTYMRMHQQMEKVIKDHNYRLMHGKIGKREFEEKISDYVEYE